MSQPVRVATNVRSPAHTRFLPTRQSAEQDDSESPAFHAGGPARYGYRAPTAQGHDPGQSPQSRHSVSPADQAFAS